jgi:hypothetical protein
MAITRAQQVRQMLEDGGRLGYRFGGGYQGSDPDTGSGGASKGSSGGGGGGNDNGGDDGNTNREKGITQQYKGPKGTTGSIKNVRDDGPDDRGSPMQNQVQSLVRLGFTPKEIRRFTNPSVIDKVRGSRFNNPITRGILRTGLYALNPSIGALDFRKAMQLKNLYDYTTDQINNPVSEEDLTLGLITDQQKQIIDKQGNIGKLTGAFDPDQTFEAAKKFDDEGGFFRDAEPMTREEFNAYISEKGYADGGRIDAMEGGIMDLESARQMLFLGGVVKSIGKAIKGATRAVKKVVKSPIGKAALIGAIGFGIPGVSSGFFSKGLAGTKFGLGAKNFLANTILGTPVGDFGTTRTGGILKKALGLVKDNPFGAITAASTVAGLLTPQQEEEAQELARGEGIDIEAARNSILAAARDDYKMDFRARGFKADGGIMRAGYQEGSKEPVAKKTMPLLDMDGKEMDLREDGGFVPIGRMEKADDVPARLSKNEFVFTADAVRNAGDGSVDKGAEVMYNMMKNLESGGEVSEESQGLSGAREMFQTSKRLEEVL